MKRLMLALFLGFSTTAAAQQPIDIYVFAGQSNMTGVLGGSFAQPLPFLNPNPSVFFNYKVTQGSTSIHESTSLKPLSTLFTTGASELPFAAAMLERGSGPICIVKVAANGTALWDGWNANLTDQWYASLVEKTLSAVDELEGMDYAPAIKGLFWVQGEGDAGAQFKANGYEANLTNLIESFREDVDTEVPFFFNRLHVDADRAAKPTFWQAQESVDANISDTHILNIDDLTLNSDDYIHFTTETQLEVGRRWADFFYPSADFDADGAVNGDDLALWSSGSIAADANSDNVVDGADFLVWQRQFAASAGSAAVPEPATLGLLAIASASLLLARKR